MEERNYYENIPEDEFVPLECVSKEFIGLYEINKLGQIRTKSSGKIRDNFNKTREGYPCVSLSSTDRTKKTISRVHILLAKTFIPNPENKPIVDHINRKRDDFSLSNLRFVTYSESSKNREISETTRYAYAKCDDNGKEVERILFKDLDKKEQRRIRDSIAYNRKYNSFTWKRIDLEVENYISKYGEPKDTEWKECLRVPDLECNLNGLFRNKKTKKLIFGSNQDGYVTIEYKRSRWFSHRLIYETFSGRLLEKDEVIDHLNTDTLDNRFSNLSAGTQSDNMSNPLTIAKKSKSILKYSLDGRFIKRYSSVKEASLEYSGKDSGFGISYYRYYFGHLWCYEGEENTIEDKVKNIIFKYNKNFELIGTFVTINAASSKFNSENLSCFFIRKFIDTGKLAPDNCYYFHGPHNFEENE